MMARLCPILVGLIMGCSSKLLVLESAVVSMVKKDTSRTERLVSGPITEITWCQGDPPIDFQGMTSDPSAMMDQLILKAHQTTNSLYFLDAKIFRDDQCLILAAKTASVEPAR